MIWVVGHGMDDQRKEYSGRGHARDRRSFHTDSLIAYRSGDPDRKCLRQRARVRRAPHGSSGLLIWVVLPDPIKIFEVVDLPKAGNFPREAAFPTQFFMLACHHDFH